MPRLIPSRRRPESRPALPPAEARRRRLHRIFKWGIVLTTLALMAVVVAAVPRARSLAIEWSERARQEGWRRLTGAGPTREDADRLRAVRRERTRRDTLASLTRFYNATSPEMRRMFDAAGMDPDHALIGVGRADNGFLLSPEVFEADDSGRSFRLRPNTASVWLRQVTLIDGPFGLFLVPDTPEMRRAAVAAGAIVDETSRQTTNSWGLRGPEPDPDADVRGIVLGDSFMQGMFNDDDHTPPLDLERELERRWGRPVSLLNTGHIGYAPEQYFHTLKALGDRFRPHFVVVSVCPNDFGDGDSVLAGRGDDWDEAMHWIGEILQWCRSEMIPYLLVVAPVDRQILGVRRDGIYPGRISDLYPGSTATYLNPFETFLDEHLRLLREDRSRRRDQCLLFNGHINDNHFSPLGSRLWAEMVARRLDAIMTPPASPGASPSADQAEDERVVQPPGEPVGRAQPLGRAVLVRDRDHVRPRPPRRGHPGGAVLEDEHRTGLDPEPRRGRPVDLRVRLAVADVLRPEQEGEAVPEAVPPKEPLGVGPPRRGGHRPRQAGLAQAVEQREQPRRGVDRRVDLGEEPLPGLRQQLLGRLLEPGHRPQRRVGDRRLPPDHRPHHRGREDLPPRREHLARHPDEQRLRVEHQPVQIERHRPDLRPLAPRHGPPVASWCQLFRI